MVLDDDGPEALDHWYSQLDVQEVIDFAIEWHQKEMVTDEKWKELNELLNKHKSSDNIKECPMKGRMCQCSSDEQCIHEDVKVYCSHINNGKNDCKCPLFHYYGDSSEETQE